MASAAAKDTLAKSRFYADVDAPICSMEVSKSFGLLTDKEKLYAHYVGKVSHFLLFSLSIFVSLTWGFVFVGELGWC